jgi:hypothetical protein
VHEHRGELDQRDDAVDGDGRQRGAREDRRLGGRGVLDQDDAAALLDRPGAADAVAVGPGHDHGDRAGAEALGGRVEQDVDRRASVLHAGLGRQGEVVVVDERVVVGGGEVDAPAAERLLVERLGEGERTAALQHGGEGAKAGDGGPVLDDDDRQREGGREVAEHHGEGGEAAERGADDHQPGAGGGASQAPLLRKMRSGPLTSS